LLRQTCSDGFRLLYGASGPAADEPLSVRVRDQPVEHELSIPYLSSRSQGCVARTFHGREERPFCRYAEASHHVMQKFKPTLPRIATGLHAKGSLSHRRQKQYRVQELQRHILDAEAPKTRRGQDNAVYFTFTQFA